MARRQLVLSLAAAAGLIFAALLATSPIAVQAGIVTCDPTQGGKLIACDLCALYDMVQTIINIAAGGLVGFSVLALVIGGIRYITSAGNENLIATGKKTMQFAIAGIVVVSLAFVIIQTVFSALTGNTGGIFSGIQCVLPEPTAQAGGGGPGTNPPPTNGPPINPPPSGNTCQGSIGGCKDSPALTQFMSCFESMMTAAGVNLGGKVTYQGTHHQNSCHFGGRSCTDGSHAVDYGGNGGAPSFPNSAQAVYDAANACGGTARGEDNAGNIQSGPFNGIGANGATHIHINVANGSCGCN